MREIELTSTLNAKNLSVTMRKEMSAVDCRVECKQSGGVSVSVTDKNISFNATQNTTYKLVY